MKLIWIQQNHGMIDPSAKPVIPEYFQVIHQKKTNTYTKTVQMSTNR